MTRLLILLALLINPVCAAAFERSAQYTQMSLGGWTVLVSSGWQADSQTRTRALQELERQLDAVARALPAEAVTELQQVRLWLENTPLHQGGGQFHRSGFWLRDNGYNPAKVGGVELNRNFYAWRDSQPMLVLHELAHAWHHRRLIDQNARIEAAYRAALASGAYGDAYAMTDPAEYFAELTEALWGTNDMVPRDADDLARIDPEGHALVRQLWGLTD